MECREGLVEGRNMAAVLHAECEDSADILLRYVLGDGLNHVPTAREVFQKNDSTDGVALLELPPDALLKRLHLALVL